MTILFYTLLPITLILLVMIILSQTRSYRNPLNKAKTIKTPYEKLISDFEIYRSTSKELNRLLASASYIQGDILRSMMDNNTAFEQICESYMEKVHKDRIKTLS